LVTEPGFISAEGVDLIYAPDLAFSVEDLAVFVLPFAGDPGGAGVAKDQDGAWH
jgi:hypothetical protein